MTKIEKLQNVVLLLNEQVSLLNNFKEDKDVGLGTFFSIENDITNQQRLIKKYEAYITIWKEKIKPNK